MEEANLIGQYPLCWKYFSALYDDSDLEVDDDELALFVVNELNLPLTTVPIAMRDNLSMLTIGLMNSWTGWKSVQKGSSSSPKENYFSSFYWYINHQMNNCASSQFGKAMMNLYTKQPELRTVLMDPNMSLYESMGPCLSTDVAKNKDFAPFSIVIKAPPSMLNTIAFTNTADDLVLKQHLGAPWTPLSTIQLLNWPHIEVCFKNKDLKFTRKQNTHYIRYLNYFSHDCKNIDEPVVEQCVSRKETREVFSYKFILEYIRKYIDSLKNIYKLEGARLEEVQVVLYQFLEDIKEMNINNSIANYTNILFRLCNIPYIRNKKLITLSSYEKDPGSPRVGYCEIITPKIELYVDAINVRPLQRENQPFYNIHRQKEVPCWVCNLPEISYRCCFCNITFTSIAAYSARQQMIEHLGTNHKMEQHVRCSKCKKQFNVLNLASYRWKHKCSKSVLKYLK